MKDNSYQLRLLYTAKVSIKILLKLEKKYKYKYQKEVKGIYNK